MKNKVFKNILLWFVAFLMVLIIIVGCYLEYVILQYYRIEDKQELEIHDRNSNQLSLNNVYSIAFNA